MSSGTNFDLKQLFAQVLKDPNSVTDEHFDQLLLAYPYAQSLSFARQRRVHTSSKSDEGILQKALLHAGNAYWLCEFVDERQEAGQHEIEQQVDEQLEVEQRAEDLHVDIAAAEESDQETYPSDESKAAPTVPAIDRDLEALILEQAHAADYFALDDLAAVETDVTPVYEGAADFEDPELAALGNFSLEYQAEKLPEVTPDNTQREADDVSVYDDDLMPYSFRWWLYKTRLAHADTYQPFVSVPSLSQVNGHHPVHRKFDETILDHQIRENIFHLQKPEDKLSDAVWLKTVEVAMPKKTDAIIERFIREEPQIQPPTPDVVNNENKARKSAEDRFSLVTETLANIYIEQSLYPKAIDVFKKLISINPEKKLYFATRIEELEQKI